MVESELEKDPKFRKWIVDKVGMKWRDYVQSEENVKRELRNQYRRQHGIPYWARMLLCLSTSILLELV